MGHAPELLDHIEQRVRRDYPSPRDVLREQRLMRERVYPDLQVVDAAGTVVCVVEIGYTRPEKLALYKRLGIGDVRWYSKAGELLNPYTVTARVKRRVVPKTEVFYFAMVDECDLCPDCVADWDGDAEAAEEDGAGAALACIWFNESRLLTLLVCDACGSQRPVAGEERVSLIGESVTSYFDAERWRERTLRRAREQRRWYGIEYEVPRPLSYRDARSYTRHVYGVTVGVDDVEEMGRDWSLPWADLQ